ncbi:sensor domain-containing diguanylate cyclase [Oceanisphaera pacifica]|uniref:diguanylate cyclase n=1 Tax=Oceanisphaera pacifica TaxID=2818389 RepID=A0ABS3NDQ2_9GAMM|nr:diguanylate cyclase [Oceanisphaera pacifica]MBO1518607.1 diguanylate cyclase [Oceanisphaera pacifica]
MILTRFILLFSLLSALVLAVTYPIYAQYYQGLQDRILANEETSVVAASQMIQKEMYEQVHLIAMIADAAPVLDYVTHGRAEQRVALETFFSNVSTNFHRFDQIRLLDNSGYELVRVNLNDSKGNIVPQSELQNKSQRYYFTEAKELADNQLFVSRLDLNMENGQIELPHKPMLRFSTPILDRNGERAGVLVLNYLAEGMLKSFRRQMSRRVDQQGMLIDAKGYWLSNHERSNEWGADLGRAEHTFARMYPEVWSEISAADSGIIATDKGLFRFQSIKPFNFSGSQHAHFKADHYPLFASQSVANTDWKLVIFIPNELIQSRSFLYQPLGQALVALVLCLLAGASLAMAIITNQKQARSREQKELNEVLSDLYDNAPCGYHSLDANAHFIRINQTELDWLGYTREEVLGQPFIAFLTPNSQVRFQEFFDALKTEKQIENVVLEMQCKDGATFYVSSSATAQNDQSGDFAVARTSVFDITDRILLEKKLETLANIDALTNISNRRHFYEGATLELKRALRYQHPLAILMFDIDHFKRVNDTYGHDGGDAVLKQLASTVHSSLRDLDVFARFGGEEFIVLLPEISPEQVALVAERLRQKVAELQINLPSGETASITISIGVAMLTPDDKLLEHLIKKADLALYQAKEQGRNRVVEYNA